MALRSPNREKAVTMNDSSKRPDIYWTDVTDRLAPNIELLLKVYCEDLCRMKRNR